MVTLYDLGICIHFIFRESTISVQNAAESIKEMEDSRLTKISFQEYKEIYLAFHSSAPTDRLYFDGIELLPTEMCEMDEEGNLYLKPQEKGKKYTIFQYPSKYSPEQLDAYYPMRVGQFEIRIWHENKVYFQWFEVLPKNVDSNEWTIMQKELEEEMQGLSSDIIRKNISIGNGKAGVLPSKELYKFLVLKNHFPTILAAFIDLREKPNYKIEKEYHLQSLSHAASIDQITIRDYLKKGSGEEKYLVANRIYNYDLPENRWLKKIIKFYEKELKQFTAFAIQYMEYLNAEIEELNGYTNKNVALIRAKETSLSDLHKYLDTAKEILYISQLIKTQEWYRQTKEADSLRIPHVLMYDARYHIFYQVYQQLRQENRNIKWDESYSYSWKLSDKMYEIWCFIKICRFLISDELGFQAKGWIFDAYEKEPIRIPELISETKVEFEHNIRCEKTELYHEIASDSSHQENLKIKLYYNKTVPKRKEETNEEENPLFIRAREGKRYARPDIRMDLYRNDTYWRSLIFEVKYRTINSFWYSSNFSCKEQIRSYKDDMKSKFYKGKESETAIIRNRPVEKVWVLHPTHLSKGEIYKIDDGIKFVQLIPGMNHQKLMETLKEEISGAFQDDCF